ncbi:MAG: sugar porter family MFS transporter [candidate division KSB1 bacterium]|nr:sugar porter family MFS transporter [candidate division KSB1 bacterium]
MKSKLLFGSAVAALGGFLFGFDTAVISGTTHWLELVFDLSPFWLGFTVASALIGTIIGALAVGRPSDVWGRRFMLFILAVLYLVSALGSALAWNWPSFLIFRLLGGLAVGGASVVSPMYIAEISPARFRGRLVGLTQFNIVFGILVAFFSNYIITNMGLGDIEWRWMFAVEAVPAAVFFLLLFSTPRSPRWLVAADRANEAADVLKQCGTDTGRIQDEIHEIQASLSQEFNALHERFFSKKYSKPILLAVMIAVFNQLSGINAIMYYAPHIFRMAGAGEAASFLQSIVIGGTNLIFTMAALTVIDKIGRKKLMIFGSIGYIVSLGITALTFFFYRNDFTETGGLIVLVSLLVFIASHAFGQGAVIWVFISEIFPNRVRARGQALGSFTHWFMAALISWTFPVIASVSGGTVFAFYMLCMVGQLIWVLKVMPETKNVSLEQIQTMLDIQ